MFRRSRRKIIAAILAVLSLLFFGTLAVIYLTSYAEVTDRNQDLLRQFVSSYRLPVIEDLTETSSLSAPETEAKRDGRGGPPGGGPNLELSTFYSVAVSYDGKVLAVDNADIAVVEEEELTDLALEIVEAGEESGTRLSLIFRMADKGGYMLVAFLDNTVMMGSTGTLLGHTMVFGAAALVLLFFLACFLADRIVTPLEESYRKQKQFISDAGHELKTPVAVIGTNLELLSRETGENPWVSNIRYENERMAELITQLLDLARTENVQPEMKTLDLSRLVLEEALPLETAAFENGMTLLTDVEEGILVSANQSQMRQLASILIDNAIRHGRNGGKIWITLGRERNGAVLTVANEGEPIPEKERAHLFERFYRRDDSRSSEEGHYGLGLAIARAITESHRGTIRVDCPEGQVTFTVRIPAARRGDFKK